MHTDFTNLFVTHASESLPQFSFFYDQVKFIVIIHESFSLQDLKEKKPTQHISHYTDNTVFLLIINLTFMVRRFT